MFSLIANSEKETLNFAAKFAKSISKGSVIVLEGDLGAGKTHFVKGFARGMKCKRTVTSPTFTLMNIYDGGRLPIYHFDLYRITDESEVENLGFEEYFGPQNDGVSLVEWPSNAPQLTKGWTHKVTIEKLNETSRKISITERGETC